MKIEHELMPGFVMEVLAQKPCETDSARPDPHQQYKVIDPLGNEDWLCGYDARVVTAEPAPPVEVDEVDA